ncbi:DUF998 domain-containing protein [Microtetraspora niveoalba]|uniref:DUF998 domain-containing protein n=1 Tax=Microtetraspora niveoalba TaxID=46175 RepID=UPI001470CFF4|nr:DUF998 domain-containing protein [Microtetraspora niveoalba]
MGIVLGYAAIGAGAAGMVLLHLISELNPLRDMISDYVFTPHGWLLPASLSLLATGAAVHALRLARLERRGAMLVGGWAGCMLLVAGFPTDRPGLSLSMSGEIHRYAAFVAFVCMPLAGLLVARRTGSRAVRVLSLIAIGSLLLVLVPYGMGMVGLDPHIVPGGLTQRMTVVAQVGALLAMAFLAGASGASAPSASPVVPDGGGRRAGALAGAEPGPDRALAGV